MLVGARHRGSRRNHLRFWQSKKVHFLIWHLQLLLKFTNSKSCIQGVCSPSTYAPVSTCPFGDDVIVNNQSSVNGIFAPLPKPQMSCEEIFAFIFSLKQDPLTFCSIQSFKSNCCSYCKSININRENKGGFRKGNFRY